ncbi:protein phosphatase regulator [Didymosphaeria variabile]|uniref:Protein phosphatase regulator n=1 Tax=Didymosphaeria variabile TaxID=1932322 RepID=A0A9W8XQP7_9PLEO|nr:protein phosphatase regulator [Didymosphaeria variabile]KAJ4356572.1 protein phosphatase regulator [Didymosphaeria variabile]
MTRPQIVRADTLDLQDKTSPTAQDHTNQPSHPAPLGIGPAAPHQEASLRRVEDERSDEEARLQNGAHNDTNGLRHDPASDDESTVAVNGNTGDNAAVRLNGGMSGEGDDADMQDADVEEDLDDMDRISSSPSISDALRQSHRRRLRQVAIPPLRSQKPPSIFLYRWLPLEDRSESQLAAQDQSRILLIDYFLLLSHSPLKIAIRYSQRIIIMISPDTVHLTQVEHRLQHMRLDSLGSLLSESDDDTLQCMLQPVPSPSFNESEDPFYEPKRSSYEIPKRTISLSRTWFEEEAHGSGQDGNPPLMSSEDEDNSWTDDSDADSWDANLHDDDDTNDVSFTFSDDPRFVDSGWGGECLREVEDIDFEFVYSLHTFVATVEGQANATKGDTMVLLDDSNSYWWLVRVVKDNSIGYLPAEHIETPTERLARLNKHRNIDLSATMLGDTAEKTKNPLKKAMRRRNAKTVQFAQPQYFEPSDYDYSSDEDDGDDLFGGADPTQADAEQQQQQETAEKSESEQDENLKVQPLKVNGSKKDPQAKLEAETGDPADEAGKGSGEKQRSSDESFDKPLDPKVSRNGTMRNTDSFFKDENTETRKITLTPNLLRDDSSTSTTGSRERGPSLESLEKNGFADKVKDDKKKKEKKPGMLSGLFKRKDKKGKGVGMDSNDSDAEPSSKQSEEYGRESPQSKPSDDLSAERASSEQSAAPSRQSSKGKLQKPQRNREESPSKVKGILKMDTPEPLAVQSATAQESVVDQPATQMTSTMRLVPSEEPPVEERALSPEKPSSLNTAASKLNPLNIVKSSQNAEPKPEKVKKAKQRVQLDDFDSDDEKDPFADPAMQPQSAQHSESEPTGRLSESPVHVSAADAQPSAKDNTQEKDQESDSQHPPGLTGDTSSQDTSSPISTPTPDDSPSTTQPSKPTISTAQAATSPDPTEPTSASSMPPPSRPAPVPEKAMDVSPPNSSESTTLPAWSDHSLRTYLDDGSDIRDMLLVINDTTGVVPVGPEHPIMSQLFVEETKTVTGLSIQLDSLLNGLLEKRSKRSGSSPVAGR